MENYGYIYLTTCILNDKKYIGKHVSPIFDTEYFGSGTHFKRAFKKYGRLNFKCEVLLWCYNEDELNLCEQYYIKLYKANLSENYYNISQGGDHSTLGNIFVYNPQTDDLRSIPCELLNNYIELGYYKGMRPRSKESKIRYKQSKKDLIPITDGIKTIYIKSSELQSYIDKGFRKGRNKPTRSNQKQEHRKWMHNSDKSIMVKEEDIDFYLSNGYEYGRGDYNKIIPNNGGWNKHKSRIEINGKITYI